MNANLKAECLESLQKEGERDEFPTILMVRVSIHLIAPPLAAVRAAIGDCRGAAESR